MLPIRPALTPPIFDAGRVSAPAAPRAVTQPGLYSKKYGAAEMGEFVRSQDFPLFQRDYSRLLDGIATFVAQRGARLKPALPAQAAADVAEGLGALKRHLFDLQRDVFGQQKALVYGTVHGKFQTLAALLEDDRIPLRKRINAVQTIAPHMSGQNPGLLNAVLQQAIAQLRYRHAGIRRDAYKVRIQMINGLVSDHVEHAHPGYAGNRSALLNTYFNHLAKQMGLPERKNAQAGAVADEIDAERIAQCTKKVLSALHLEVDAR